MVMKLVISFVVLTSYIPNLVINLTVLHSLGQANPTRLLTPLDSATKTLLPQKASYHFFTVENQKQICPKAHLLCPFLFLEEPYYSTTTTFPDATGIPTLPSAPDLSPDTFPDASVSGTGLFPFLLSGASLQLSHSHPLTYSLNPLTCSPNSVTSLPLTVATSSAALTFFSASITLISTSLLATAILSTASATVVLFFASMASSLATATTLPSTLSDTNLSTTLSPSLFSPWATATSSCATPSLLSAFSTSHLNQAPFSSDPNSRVSSSAAFLCDAWSHFDRIETWCYNCEISFSIGKVFSTTTDSTTDCFATDLAEKKPPLLLTIID
ncbi:hypothetical protein C7212DRAFT_342317 [Tuber magnatum]|uniref:Uncharacterized protein n=1 Tax=Tuber magnatum TaxID=42249 RepID=A0A317SW49_9PEZI|nr:hypothetical protein C7212DRAFT_342317 [Tuber magnatum]